MCVRVRASVVTGRQWMLILDVRADLIIDMCVFEHLRSIFLNSWKFSLLFGMFVLPQLAVSDFINQVIILFFEFHVA